MRRILTALALFPLAIYLVMWANPWLFSAAVALVACLCYYEYERLASSYAAGDPGFLGFVVGLLFLYPFPPPWPWLILIFGALAALALAMRANDLTQSLPRAALLTMGVTYAFGTWKCAPGIRAHSPHWLLYSLLVVWAGDIGAYYVGRTFGKHRLARRVSPGKTWEGTAGSVIASLIVAGGYLLYFVPAVPLAAVIVVTIVANAAGQLGDLAESAIKRGAGAKDSGAILPGHGGMLDRVDSAMFVMPVVYAYLQLVAPLQ